MGVTPMDVYDDWLAGRTFEQVSSLFADRGCTEVLVKPLAAKQDNDKNQVYVGGDLSQVAKIPSGDVVASTTSSRKPGALGKTKFIAPLKFSWIARGGDSLAPQAKLIFYPQYPEVRLSGLIAGSVDPPKSLYRRAFRGQETGRILLIGLRPEDDRVWAMILPPESVAAKQIIRATSDEYGVFSIWRLAADTEEDPRRELLEHLAQVHALGWIPGQRISAGELIPYSKMNAGGYTLEAMLGIAPNGRGEPDFVGWELKAHRVSRLSSGGPGGSPLTLMTPEPTGGLYKEQGVRAFMAKYGRTREDRPERVDFTGRHFVGKLVEASNTTLVIEGWDGERGLLPDGAINLVDASGTVAASWGFEGLMNHWKRKHTRTCYVDYMSREVAAGKEFRYGSKVLLCQETSFFELLRSFAQGHVYYDPGINMKLQSDGTWLPKRRSQFRVAYANLPELYRRSERVDCVEATR